MTATVPNELELTTLLALDRELEPGGTRSAAPGQRHHRPLLAAVDLAAATGAWALALALPSEQPSTTAAPVVVEAAFLGGGTAAAMAFLGLYRTRLGGIRALETAQLLRAVSIVGACLLAVRGLGATRVAATPAQVLAGTFLALILLLIARAAYRALAIGRARRHGRPVVVVGGNEEARELCRLISKHCETFRVEGVLSDGPPEGFDVPWLGSINMAAAAARERGAGGAVVAASALTTPQVNGAVRELLAAGVRVQLSTGLRGIACRRLRPAQMGLEPLFDVERVRISGARLAIKRALDLVLGALMLVLLSPLLTVAALAIKMQDGGPVLFRQRRVGRGNRTFTLYKLRTMVPDAEAQLPALLGHNERTGGPLFKLTRDPRVTRVGRILRATSLDEVPQLLNVLQGRMSLVGPRPALPEEVAKFPERMQARATVAPGITGLWQVEARDDPLFSSYERFDLFYVENWSISLDLAIIGATAWDVLTGWTHVVQRRSSLPILEPEPAVVVLD